MKDSTFFKWVAIGLGAIAAWWARIPHAEQGLLALMSLDLAMGALGALIKREFSPGRLFDGIVTKVRTLLFLGAAVVGESLFKSDLSFELHRPVTYFLCFYELSSLVRSYVKYGGHVPPVFMAWLDRLRVFTNGNAKPPEPVRSESD